MRKRLPSILAGILVASVSAYALHVIYSRGGWPAIGWLALSSVLMALLVSAGVRLEAWGERRMQRDSAQNPPPKE